MPAGSTPSVSANEDRLGAVLARDGVAAHAFYICVRTTGVYCIATCAGQQLGQNVFLVPTHPEAEAVGMRPLASGASDTRRPSRSPLPTASGPRFAVNRCVKAARRVKALLSRGSEP